MVLTRPVLGYGPGNYRIEYPRFWTPYEQKWFADELKMNAHVHNDLLEIAADAGLPAAGLYLVFLVLGISYGMLIGFTRDDPLQRRLGFTVAAVFCAFLVDGLFGFNLRVPVSATVLFLMAGALEGIWLSSGPVKSAASTRWWPQVWKPAALIVAATCVVLDSGVFVSQMLLQRGNAQISWRQYNPAERTLRRGERLAPWNWNFARQRGIACLNRRDYAAAVEHLQRALRKNPQYIMTLVPLARATLSLALAGATTEPKATAPVLEALDAAAAYAQRILALCPMFPSAEEILGRVDMGRAMLLNKASDAAKNAERIAQAWRDAETHFTRALQFGEKNVSETYRQLAQVRTALGNPNGAEEALIRATQADPADELNWPFFYSFAERSKLYDKFREALLWRIERLREQQPPDTANLTTAYLWLASTEQDGYQNLDAAETAYRNAISCQPLRPAVWSAYARFAETTQRWDSFRKFLMETNSQVLANGKQPLPHVMALAKVWNRGPEALVQMSAMLVGVIQRQVPVAGLRPVELEMKWAIARLLEEVKCGPLSPRDTGLTLLHLGMVCNGTNELELANWIFPAAMPNLPAETQGVCAQHWADTLIRLGRAPEAVNLLRDVAGRSPEDRDVRLALARSLAKNNNVTEAQTEYEGLLKNPALTPEERTKIQAELNALLKR
jgi:tetratricopeptide (TPR) repeat protein